MKTSVVNNLFDLNKLVNINWNRIKSKSQNKTQYVWLVQRLGSYFTLYATNYKIRPKSKYCWYVGEVNKDTIIDNFVEQFQSNIMNAFIKVVVY